MRKFLLSILTVSTVAVVAVVATGAFFSDTETSAGNTFVAGSVDLRIDSACHYDNMVCNENNVWQDEGNRSIDPQNPGTSTRPELLGTACTCRWPEKNLVGEKYFNLTDIKPGDFGENTISLHVIDNDAWACVTVDNLMNYDNSCTDPELDVEQNVDCGLSVEPAGELAQNLNFFAWAETDGDNVWEDGELPLFSNIYGPASDVLNGRTYTLADSNLVTGPLVESTTYYIGLAWCAGTMTVNDDPETITCNGDGMGNDTQTDSLTADIEFFVEQSRNNPDFTCED